MQTKYPNIPNDSLLERCTLCLLPELSLSELRTLLFLRFTPNSTTSTIQKISVGVPGVSRGTGLDRGSIRRALRSLQAAGLVRRGSDGEICLKQLSNATRVAEVGRQ